MTFWAAVDGARNDIRRALISDQGLTEIDAPRALLAIADGFAQATFIRDSAFQRITEAGGPLTSADRGRRAFAVWESASASVERHARLLGLKRVAKPVADPLAYVEGRADA
jgi:hypothetical protein